MGGTATTAERVVVVATVVPGSLGVVMAAEGATGRLPMSDDRLGRVVRG